MLACVPFFGLMSIPAFYDLDDRLQQRTTLFQRKLNKICP